MKNKKVVYVLLIAVIIIWGGIIARLFGVFSNNEPSFTPKTSYRDPVIKTLSSPDTFDLLKSYEDPFLRTRTSKKKRLPKASRTSKELKLSNARVKKETQEKEIDWSFINFKGIIKGKPGLTALVQINGNPYVLNEGDTVQNVVFHEIGKDSVKVSYEKDQTYIVKK